MTALGSLIAGSAKAEALCGLRSWTGSGAAEATALGSSIVGFIKGERGVLAVSNVDAGELSPVPC